MVSRNGDTVTFALGIAGGILGLLAFILTCVGVALPSWYIASNANNTLTVGQCGLFTACYIPNVSSSTTTTSTFTCVSYSSYVCSTSSYRTSAFNITATLSGCVNPNSDAASYSTFDAPIYQTVIDDFYRLRAGAVLSIISILFTFFSFIFTLLSGLIVLNIYLVFIAPILAILAIIFGICCLVVVGSVFTYSGAGFALFTVGIVLESMATILSAIIAGRLNGMRLHAGASGEESVFLQPIDSYSGVRRVQKRKT